LWKSASDSIYINFEDNNIVQKFCEIIFINHIILKKNLELINNSDVQIRTRNSLKRKKVLLYQYLLASSTKSNCVLTSISREDINMYTESVKDMKFPGTMPLASYSRTLLKYSGNTSALALPIKETIKEYYLNLISNLNSNEINKKVLNDYKELIQHLIKIIEFECLEHRKSETYSRQMVAAVVLLLSYLSGFSKKLNAIELSKMLNTIILDEKGIYNWVIKQNEKIKFCRYTPFYLLFFDNLPAESEYKRIFEQKWLLTNRKKSSERSFIRNGFEYPIYITFQEIVLYNPPKTMESPTLRSTPNGEQVDMSWWKHDDTNPIIAISTWLISKLPRRSTHILNLDVNTFLQYNPDGTLKGFYINTDKNQNLNANNKFIPAFLVNILFSKEELKILESYVKYIKEVYFHYVPVEYKNGGNYEPIQPLFPHLDKNDVFPRQILSAFYTKTLLKTQIKVNELSKKGFFDNFYSDELRKVKTDYLSKCILVRIKDNNKISLLIQDISDVEELGYSLNKWYEIFASIDGMHNMRHAGSTALLSREGLSLMQIKIITGHTSLDTLVNIYIYIYKS
jgi:integrase